MTFLRSRIESLILQAMFETLFPRLTLPLPRYNLPQSQLITEFVPLSLCLSKNINHPFEAPAYILHEYLTPARPHAINCLGLYLTLLDLHLS